MSEISTAYSQLRADILNGKQSCENLVDHYVKVIDAKSDLNAYLFVFDEEARDCAGRIDRKIASGTAGKLAGMVIGVKDILAVKDRPATCGSKILEPFVSPYNATVIERLAAEDAIFIGKTNMDEFGMGSSNENSAYGPVKHPIDPRRIPGGSSGGSAVSVAAGMSMTALGSDTGGSVRQPASHCGVIGLRPTYGRVSRYGLIAFASSLDQVGVFSNDIRDCASVFEVIAGNDPRDATASAEPVPDCSELSLNDIRGVRIGRPAEYFQEGLESDICAAIDRQFERLASAGAEIVDVTLPNTDYGIATYYLICTAEASSNLSRFDGVRFGLRKQGDADLRSMYEATRSAGFGKEVRRRIMLGTYVLSAGYYDAYYRKAQKVRTLIREDFNNAFQSCDFILGPVSPTTAFPLGDMTEDPLQMYLSDVYTVTAPLAGIPAISIPTGMDSNNLPIGLQITAPAFQEKKLFEISDWILKH